MTRMKGLGFFLLVLACNTTTTTTDDDEASMAGGRGGGGGVEEDDEEDDEPAGGRGGKGGSKGTSPRGGGAGMTAKGGSGGGGGADSSKGGTGGSEKPATGGNGGTAGTAPVMMAPGCTAVAGTVRDFKAAHPDFQFEEGAMRAGSMGMVEAALGADKKPVLKPEGVGPMGIAESADSWKEWFNDKAGVNMTVPVQLMVKQFAANFFEFGPTDLDGNFFPINDKGFGNKDMETYADSIQESVDQDYNQLLTLELHTEFVYQGGIGEMFMVQSDDDSWVFINGKLAIDQGGLHGVSPKMLKLDEVAATLGLEKGKTYPLDVFFADRQFNLSILRVQFSKVVLTGCAK